MNMEPVHAHHARAPSCCRSRTSTPTRSSRRASSRRPARRASGDKLFADWRYDADGQPKPDFVLNQPGAAGRGGPRRGRQLRLRLVARARAVGAPRLRLPRRRQHVDRRHLPQQRAQERPAADRRRRSDARQAARGTRARSVTIVSTTRRSRCPTAARATVPDRPVRALLPDERRRRAGFLLSQEAAITAFEARARLKPSGS